MCSQRVNEPYVSKKKPKFTAIDRARPPKKNIK